MSSWRRVIDTSFNYTAGAFWADAQPNGQTYERVHVNTGFYLDSPVETDLRAIANNIWTCGLVTTIGNGTETPPDPRTASGDAAPPTQRWIWWQTFSPVVSAIDRDAGVVLWQNSQPTESMQTKGQVFATGVPAGESLNLWFVWSAPFDYTTLVGSALVWVALSILHKN